MKLLLLLSLTVLFTSAFAGYTNIRTKNNYDGSLDSSCEYDDDCIVRNSFCKGNRLCSCKNKFKYDRKTDSCNPTELNLKCVDQDDCPFPQSECRDQVCQCQYNHVASEFAPNCLPSSRLQAQCQDDQQCRVSDPFSHCNTTAMKCDCNVGFHAAIDSNQCVANKRVRERCGSTTDCINSPDQQGAVECKPDADGNRKCLCSSGDFVERNNVCVRGTGGAGELITSITAILISSLAIYFC